MGFVTPSDHMQWWWLLSMDNIQQITDAVQKGLLLIVRASVQQGKTRLTSLRNELCSDSLHAVLA